jgi:hypothetical protein
MTLRRCANRVASFIITSVEGSLGLAKAAQSLDVLGPPSDAGDVLQASWEVVPTRGFRLVSKPSTFGTTNSRRKGPLMRSHPRTPSPRFRTVLLGSLALGGVLALPLDTQAQVRGDEHFARTFDAGASALIDVNVSDADVRVDSHRGDGVEVRVLVRSSDPDDARDYFEAMDFEASVSGNRVTVEARDPQMGRDWWRGGRDAGATVWISAPEGVELDVHTSDGDIDIGDFSGEVSVRTSDGDVTAGRLSGRRITIQSSDGDLDVERISGGDAELRTSDGDVQVVLAGGSLDAQSGDGDLRVELDSESEVRVRTGDGDIALYIPTDMGAELLLQGEDLDIDRDVRIHGRISEGRIQGRRARATAPSASGPTAPRPRPSGNAWIPGRGGVVPGLKVLCASSVEGESAHSWTRSARPAEEAHGHPILDHRRRRTARGTDPPGGAAWRAGGSVP